MFDEVYLKLDLIDLNQDNFLTHPLDHLLTHPFTHLLAHLLTHLQGQEAGIPKQLLRIPEMSAGNTLGIRKHQVFLGYSHAHISSLVRQASGNTSGIPQIQMVGAGNT
jgi:hypothetical protein